MPENGIGSPPREARWRYYGLQAKLETNQDIIRKWLYSLSYQAKQRIEARSYPDVPLANYLLIDQGELEGYVQVEIPIFYDLDVDNLPHYVVRRKDSVEQINILNAKCPQPIKKACCVCVTWFFLSSLMLILRSSQNDGKLICSDSVGKVLLLSHF